MYYLHVLYVILVSTRDLRALWSPPVSLNYYIYMLYIYIYIYFVLLMGGSTGTHNISCHWKVYPISTSQSTSLHYFFSCVKLVQQGTCASLSHKEHHPIIYIYIYNIYIYNMYVSRNNVANQNTIWYNIKSLGLSFSTLLVSWYFQCLWSLSIFHTYPLILSYMDLGLLLHSLYLYLTAQLI